MSDSGHQTDTHESATIPFGDAAEHDQCCPVVRGRHVKNANRSSCQEQWYFGDQEATPLCDSELSCYFPHPISAMTCCSCSRSSVAGSFAATFPMQSSSRSSTMT